MANPKNFIPAKKKYAPRQPKGIAQILGDSARSLRISSKLKSYAAFPEWPEVVGPAIAQVSYPEKILYGNLLIVRVIDTAWAQELSMQKETILDKINHHGKGSHINDIRFVVGSPISFKPA